MNRKILIYIGLILIILLIVQFKSSEQFSTENLNKKKILITGLRAQVLAEFIQNQLSNLNLNQDYELIIHTQTQEPKLSDNSNIIFGPIGTNKEIVNTVGLLGKSGPYDLIIHNLHDPKLVSGSILNVNKNLIIKNQIEFIDSIIKYVNTNGKIVSFITNLEEFSGSKILDYNMGYFIKEKAVKNYSNAIGFTTIKFPELSSSSEHLSSVINWILQNPWQVLTGREFYSNQIHDKTPGYIFGFESNVKYNLKSEFPNLPNPHGNYQSLKSQIANANNVELNNICFFSNTKSFLTNIIEKFVPEKHHIILFNLPDHNFIPINRAITTDTGQIKNKQLVPDFKKILEKINSHTRLVYLAGFIGANEFIDFIGMIPKNILVIVDMTWYNFTYFPDKSAMSDYKVKGTNRCIRKKIGKSIGISQFVNFPNVIAIDTITKIYGLTNISLGYSVASSELSGIINTVTNTLDSFDAKAIIDKITSPEVQNEKKFYSEQLEKFIGLLDKLKINYHITNPITIKIILDKSDQTNLSIVMENITPSNAKYIDIIKSQESNQVIIYLDNELANKQNELIIRKLKVRA